LFFALGFCVTGGRVEAVCNPRKKTARLPGRVDSEVATPFRHSESE
jgi:hypothetical protein